MLSSLVLMYRHERPVADQPRDMVIRPRVLVEDGILVEQPPIPGLAALQVGDGEGDMGDGRELGHPSPFSDDCRGRNVGT
jgi:hypothetical protein